jgi:energy-coupling factor transporter ATP-binding protein EcfA2
MIDVGLKFSVGKKAESPVEALEREKAAVRASEQKTYQQKLDEMKLMYLEEIAELESELEAAQAEGDSVRSAQIAADKQKAESTYNTLNGAKTRTDSVPSGEILMRISPEQLERLIRTILEGVKEMKPEVEKIKMNADSTTISEQGHKIDSLNSRINRLEKKLVALDTSQQVGVQRTSAQLTEQGVNDETLEKLEQLQKDYENLTKDVEQIDEKVGIQPQQAQQPVVINAGQPQQSSEPVVLTQTTNEDGTQKVTAVEVDDLKEGTFDFSGVSPMIGFNLGGAFTFNIGVRAHMPIQSSKLEFTPEFFYGFGNRNSIGVIANIVYPLTLNESKLKPYGGAGIGIWKIDGKSNLGLNLLAGTYLDLWEGKLFTDVSLRGLKHVQIGIGYTFDF